MSNPIDRYLDQVLFYASLTPGDSRKVRGELKDHLTTLIGGEVISDAQVFDALEKFGDPKEIGQGIARSKGRLRTYFKKQLRRNSIRVAAALALALLVRATVVQAFICTGQGVAPIITPGNQILVYKLASNFDPGDVIVFRVSDGTALLGTVISQDAGGNLNIHRTGVSDQLIPRDRIVGRVIANTR